MEQKKEDLKYEIVKEQFLELEGKPKLFRIRALRDIPNKHIQQGDYGGWIEEEDNLSQSGDCWIGELAMVYDGSRVKDFALVTGRADISRKSTIKDHAMVVGNIVLRNVCLDGCAKIHQRATVEDSIVKDYADVGGNARVSRSELYEDTSVGDDAFVSESRLSGNVIVSDAAIVNMVVADGFCAVRGHAIVRASTLSKHVTVNDTASVLSSDLDGEITVGGTADIKRCTKIHGEGLVIGWNAVLFENNYMVMGPLNEVSYVIFYFSDHHVVYSANNELFENPNELIVYLSERVRVKTKYLRDIVFNNTKLLMMMALS